MRGRTATIAALLGLLTAGVSAADELLEIAGADPIFRELRHCGLAKDRVVALRASPMASLSSTRGSPKRLVYLRRSDTNDRWHPKVKKGRRSATLISL